MTAIKEEMKQVMKQEMRQAISLACNKAQEALWSKFREENHQAFRNHSPAREDENWIYWWHAHALDALLDGYARTGDRLYLDRFREEYEGTKRANGDTLLHNWYDDMEWMALVMIRAYDITGDICYKEQALLLWEDIQTAWNESCGGGMAWKKDQLDYKNTPANGPAAIIAFRLFQRFGREEDLEWGKKILEWNLNHLMNQETCLIWDGMNRLGDGSIDYYWKFTYCQGVIVGAALEYYKITKKKEYLELAGKVARRAVKELADPEGIFPYEGPDDCGLFRGIYFRYVLELTRISDDFNDLVEMILKNGSMIAEEAINEEGLIGGDWRKKEAGTVDLAQHLSGLMALEMAAAQGR